MYLWQKINEVLPDVETPVIRDVMSMTGSWLKLFVMIVVVLTCAGCATQHQRVDKGKEAMEVGNWDAAVYYYLEALTIEPANITYKNALARARQKASQEHFSRGAKLQEINRLFEARDELYMAVQLDPTNQFAAQLLGKVTEDIEILSQPDGEKTLEEMKRAASEAKVKPPVLDPRSKEAITLNFPKAKPVKEIYRAISKAYGFNVLFDPKLKDDEIAVELTDVTAERALEIVLQAAGHFYKVLDEHSIIIVEETPQNRREYEDLVIKTFFLSNAEVKDVDKLLRSLIEARRLASNEQLNTITLRDTADKVAIAEQLIRVNDKAKAEVLINVELLEADTQNLEEIGMKLSTQSFGIGLDTGKVSPDNLPPNEGSLYLPDLKNITRGAWFVNVPSVIINLVKTTSEASLLAQPQMRITEGEKGSLVIGDRIPIPVTSFNTGNSIGGSVVPITSFQYQDVGIKIDVEPRVHHNREVTLKVSVEVSQVTGEVTQNGQSQPIIGTRNINTVIRLKEGETNMLVGLYKKDVSITEEKIPGLSAIPFLGRLFTNKALDVKTIDLVLTLTPHIIRFPDIDEEDLAPLWVGTESRISFFGSNSPRVQSGREKTGPFDEKRDEKSKKDSRVNRPRDKDSSPFHTPQSSPRRPGSRGRGGSSQGVDLTPGGKLGNLTEDDAEDSIPVTVPLAVSLEPSVLSLRTGRESILQLIVAGGTSSFDLPLDIQFNANRLRIEDIDVAPGFVLENWSVDEENGRLSIDLRVESGDELPQVAAQLRVSGLELGSSTLVFSPTDLMTPHGDNLVMVADGAAVFVLDEAVGE